MNVIRQVEKLNREALWFIALGPTIHIFVDMLDQMMVSLEKISTTITGTSIDQVADGFVFMLS
jgi:hypothetical protein